jgi:group I intron endonuclease
MENKFIIYMHTSPNGKSYIGQTCNLIVRNRGHQNKTGCRAFHSAITKYGWDNFTHEILAEGLTLDEANIQEAAFIAEHNTLSPNGYNLREGGNNARHSEETKALQRLVKLGKKHTPESIARMSHAQKNRNPEIVAKIVASNTGKKRDDATRQRMAESMRGIKRSEEGRANIKAGKQNISDETKEKLRLANIGKKASEETKAKLSAIRTGRKMPKDAIEKSAAARRGRVVSAETRAKQSASTKGRASHNKGVPMSEEQKEKMRQAKKYISPETRARMADANKAAWEKRKANGTGTHSPEHRANMSASRKAKKEAATATSF